MLIKSLYLLFLHLFLMQMAALGAATFVIAILQWYWSNNTSSSSQK